MSDSIASMSLTRSNQASTSILRQPSNKHTLMKFPAEIRQMIFKHLFDSTRLTFGYRQIKYGFRKVLPSRNALAILRVCRQIYQEADHLWLSRVLFNFEDGMTLIDKLSSLPISTLEQIRHVRTRMLQDEPEIPAGITEELAHGLRLLPGLKLDTLSLVSPWRLNRSDYFGSPDINRFLRTKFPCKELHLITPGSPFHETDKWTHEQASGAFEDKIDAWANTLTEAGDAAPQVTIAVFQSTELNSDLTGTVYNDSARQVLEETVISPAAIKSKLVKFGKTLHSTAETLVIFKDVSASPTIPDAVMTEVDEVSVVEIADSEADGDEDELITRTWVGDVRDEYLFGRENDDLENMTTGELFSWPHEMRAAYIIFDKYKNVDDVIWPGKNLDQAWEGARIQ
ncbi:hypothetical protein SBOR_3348 [Sclerotinia borealis F-4128]|uniref:F-box domain-containing protein n=1 Tax=Sclerotinia borealis (strain F-4128) TaxID=1432307 RepID=W9CK02_SCLBF|nr:hypothetical protein SBOR_3348 [Sclerotinia borealis F-4128]